MSQILPDEAASAPEDPLDPEAPAFGKALSERPPLESSHATLTRTHWVRRTIEQALQGRTVKAEVQADGRLALVLDEPLSRDILQYDLSPKSEYDRFELFSLDNGKMRCPTWDLVAGPPSVGGTCPAASAGQTICEPNIRRTMLTEAKSAAPRGADRQPVAKGQLILTERMPTKDGKMVPVPFWEGDEPAPNQFRTPICQYCVTGDTRVLVRGRGLVSIADLVGAGDFEVWSGRAWQKTHAEMTGVRPTVTVRTNWGLSVRCTDNHLVKVAVGFIPAGELEPGERLDLALPSEVAMPATKKLPDMVARTPYQTSVEANFPTEWSFEVGTFLGYILGDGSVSGGQYPQVTLCAAQHDREDIERIQKLVASWCSTETSIRDVVGLGSELVPATGKPTATIAWRVQALADFLASLGLDKSGDPSNYAVPSTVWEASADGVRGFLSGMFSTDGSVVTFGGKVGLILASVSRRLLEGVQLLLTAFGIRSSICEYTTSNKWRVEEGYRQLFKLEIASIGHVRRFAERVGFFNKRKQAHLEDLLRADKREETPRFPAVVSVQRNDVLEPVYDLFDVGPEHQFVANGLTVHNCYASAGNYRGMHVAVGGIVRYHWTKKLIEQDPELWVRTIVTAFKQLPYPQEGAGTNLIMPARVHSTGDFFSPAYAQAWIQVANALHAWDPRIILWAPTRSWATPYWADTRENGQSHWQRLLDPDNLVSARRGKRLNFVVRASAYHVGDEAPGKLHPTNAVGTTSIFVPDNQTTEKKTDPRYDVDCPVYDRTRDAKSCRWAFDPVTGELGCRVCWRNKDIRVNFTTH